tara:strand:+ start:119 stop:361 length:243 start_codon:yes stop_codon:yes gene_type:complete
VKGGKHDCLFDIDEYKASEVVYQVRHVLGESDAGEVIATFKELDHVLMMRGLHVPKGELIVVKFTKDKGVTDIYGQGYDL